MKCYCGNYEFEQCQDNCQKLYPKLSLEDRINAQCKYCKNYPKRINKKWIMQHRNDCNNPNPEDPRKTGLKMGLRQLNVEQLQKVINYQGKLCLDNFNYENGKICPLGAALDLDKIDNLSHEKVYNTLIKMNYVVYNTKGIEGKFYRENRQQDLIIAAKEVWSEKI